MIGAASLASNTSRVAPSIHDCIPPDGCILLAGGFAVGLQLALLRAALDGAQCRDDGIWTESSQRKQTVLRLVLVLALIFQNFLVLEQVEVSEVVTEATELAGVLAEIADVA